MTLAASECAAAVEALRMGQVVAVATESFFALMANAADAQALSRLFALKGRDAGKGVALMVPSVAVWRRWSHPSPLALHLAQCLWPGPLTIATAAAADADSRLVVEGTIGARQAGPSAAAEVTAAFGGAVTATSANLAGEPPITSSAEVELRLASRSNELLILPGSCPGGLPSTIVRIDADDFQIVRSGAVGEDVIAECLAGASPHSTRR